MGRFMSPDWNAKVEPVPYSKLDEPQTLNLYSYALNNPVTGVDPDGHACAELLLNTDSGFCQRAAEYGRLDASPQIRGETRFFAAASAVSLALADVDAPRMIIRWSVSKQTATFLENLGEDLEKRNLTAAIAILTGSLDGPGLDARMVHMEQTEVQAQLDNLQKTNSGEYNTAIKEINGLLNPGTLGQIGSGVYNSDAAFGMIVDQVRKSLGRNIDFSNQADREKLGNTAIDFVRSGLGCAALSPMGSICASW